MACLTATRGVLLGLPLSLGILWGFILSSGDGDPEDSMLFGWSITLSYIA